LIPSAGHRPPSGQDVGEVQIVTARLSRLFVAFGRHRVEVEVS